MGNFFNLCEHKNNNEEHTVTQHQQYYKYVHPEPDTYLYSNIDDEHDQNTPISDAFKEFFDAIDREYSIFGCDIAQQGYNNYILSSRYPIVCNDGTYSSIFSMINKSI